MFVLKQKASGLVFCEETFSLRGIALHYTHGSIQRIIDRIPPPIYLSELQRMYVFKVWLADHGLKSIPRFDLRSRGPVVDRVIKKRPLRDLERIMIPNSFRDHSLWLIWLVRPRSRSTGKWSQSQSASEKNKTSRSSLPRPRDSPSSVLSSPSYPPFFRLFFVFFFSVVLFISSASTR